MGSDLWVVTLADWTHNHDRELPSGAPAPCQPTTAQKYLVQRYSTSATSNFNRTQLTTILKEQFPDHVLEPRQVSNLINASRAHAREEIDSLGGDVATIIAHLQEKQSEDPGWTYDLRLNEQQQVIGLWWQSPVQAGLTRRFSDILINDNTYNRNQYGYPLNIGIGIDNLGSSRNLWYALHETEDVETQNWVNRCHLRSASKPPECYVSDRHPSLIQSAKTTLPLTSHFYCLYHLEGNVATNLRPRLGSDWESFARDFWASYRSPSPDEFDQSWKALTIRYPKGQDYLEELYQCRDRWAWAWISTIFTAGVRTNGRVEVENKVNKAIGGPKKTLFQLFRALNERTSIQSVAEMIRVRDVCDHLSTHNTFSRKLFSLTISPHGGNTKPRLKVFFAVHWLF